MMQLVFTGRSPSRADLFYLLFPPLIILLVLTLVEEPADGVRLAFLFLPGCWFAWRAVESRSLGWMLLTHLWAFIFSVDTTFRAACRLIYDSDLNSTFILEAIANTSVAEVIEYLLQYFYLMPALIICSLFINVWYVFFLPKIKPKQEPIQLIRKIFLGFFCLLSVAAYAVAPSRDLHPFLFWPKYSVDVNDFRLELANSKVISESWSDSAIKEQITYQGPVQQTFVLVIGESITRNNVQLCGYSRETTPKLAELRNQITLFCNAFSPAASTIPALRMMLTDATLRQPKLKNAGSFLARARHAGFKLFWISNQDDEYTSALFGEYADESVFLSRESGRNSASMDEVLISAVDDALSDVAPLKLIVVHTVGAHPNYFMRYPREFDVFNDYEDGVSKEMEALGRNYFIRQQRDFYDNAIRYHDFVVAALLESVRRSSTPEGRFTLLYASDHGNEVGHQGNHVGHSPKTQAGYAIPVLLWSNRFGRQRELEPRQIVTDTLDVNIMRLMEIRWSDYRAQDDWFTSSYSSPVELLDFKK